MKKAMMVLMVLLLVAVPLVSAELTLKEVRSGEVKERIPETLQEAEAEILPVQNRYLMYTHDGKNIMWGTYGRGYFAGQDNHGKRAWGIYGKYVFAGMYDGKFFYGRYHNGKWTAHGLFGMRSSRGKYLLFPTLTAVSARKI